VTLKGATSGSADAGDRAPHRFLCIRAETAALSAAGRPEGCNSSSNRRLADQTGRDQCSDHDLFQIYTARTPRGFLHLSCAVRRLNEGRNCTWAAISSDGEKLDAIHDGQIRR